MTSSALNQLCAYGDCDAVAEIHVGSVGMCTDPVHIRECMTTATAPARALRDALIEVEAAPEPDPWSAGRATLVGHYLSSAGRDLRAAERVTANLDTQYSQSIAAVALQAEDLFEQLRGRRERAGGRS